MPTRRPAARRLGVAVASLLLLPVTAGSTSRTSPAARPVTRVFLVRHAERFATEGDANPTLTPAGSRRAALLGRMLRSAHVAAIFATPFERAKATADSVSAATGAPVDIVHSDSSAQLARIVRERFRGRAVVIVGHSDSLPNVVAELGWEGDEATRPWSYDELCLLELRADEPSQRVHLHYGGPADTTGMSGPAGPRRP